MKKMNLNKIFLFVMLIILFVGIANATEISDYADSTDTIQVVDNNLTDMEDSYTKKDLTTKNIKKDSNVKKQTTTTVSTTKGIIGNSITLNADIVDEDDNPVTNGYAIFKLNGITIKDNKKLTGSSNNLKVYVKDGIATVNITADLNMRHAKNLTAVYAGSSIYNASRSNTATAEIALRNASINVSSDLKIAKHGENITLTATVKDITNKTSSDFLNHEEQYVFFKINGITLKDDNGQTLKVSLINNTATTKYEIPRGLSGVTDCKTMTPKNHIITAGLVNPNYYPTARANNTFIVERSKITINFYNTTIDPATNRLILNATFVDRLGYNVIGPNKYIVKLNGATYKLNNKTAYYQANDGIVQLNSIIVPTFTTYTKVEVVTQDRLAYQNQRKTITVILPKQKTKITINNITNPNYTKNVTVTGKLTDIYNHPLKNLNLAVTLNYMTTTVKTDNNGNFKFTNQTTKAGINTITAYFQTSENYLNTTTRQNFTVINVPTNIYCQATDTNYTNYTTIYGYLVDDKYNNLKNAGIILKINNEIYNTKTDEEGDFSFTYKTNKAGINNITATFNGTPVYKKASTKTTFQVEKMETLVYVDYILPVALGEYVTVTGGLVDYDELPIKNAKITLKINTNKYYLTTDIDGEFIYTFKTNKTGSNTITATYYGDANYQNDEDSTTFSVVKSYNMTISMGSEKIVGNDIFECWYQNYDAQHNRGVYVEVNDRFATDMDDLPENMILNTTFYYKNSKGNVIKKQFTEGNGLYVWNDIISGYTPYKVDITYRKMTQYELDLWEYGYAYDSISREWYFTRYE